MRSEREPCTDANVDRALQGQEISEAVYEVPLMEEEAVAGTETVPKESCRLRRPALRGWGGVTIATGYQELIDAADDDYRHGRFKEAHITYGQAVAAGGGRDDYCRHMRGVCSRHVAEQRLQKALEQPEKRQPFLNQAARWLAKSEANLDSAFYESPDDHKGTIRLEQAQTEEIMARFMEMAGGDPGRRLDTARRYREEGLELLDQS